MALSHCGHPRTTYADRDDAADPAESVHPADACDVGDDGEACRALVIPSYIGGGRRLLVCAISKICLRFTRPAIMDNAYVSGACVLVRIAGGCVVLKACIVWRSMVQYGSVA